MYAHASCYKDCLWPCGQTRGTVHESASQGSALSCRDTPPPRRPPPSPPTPGIWLPPGKSWLLNNFLVSQLGKEGISLVGHCALPFKTDKASESSKFEGKGQGRCEEAARLGSANWLKVFSRYLSGLSFFWWLLGISNSGNNWLLELDSRTQVFFLPLASGVSRWDSLAVLATLV